MKLIFKLIITFVLLIYSTNILYPMNKSERIDKLSKNLRCLICQGQSVYDSQSDFALSIKDFISKKIDEGENDQDIYKYLKTKYGDWIMYEPELGKNTVLLWILPLILFIFGGLLIFKKAIIKLYKKNDV